MLKNFEYHAKVLDLMGLDTKAKLQLHVGGVYGDNVGSMRRSEERCATLPNHVGKQLVIENDDVSYSLSDCMESAQRQMHQSFLIHSIIP